MERTLLSSKGQVVIPKAVRDALHLEPGTEFTVKTQDNQVILQPVKSKKRFTARDLAGSIPYTGPALSIKEMEAAISRRIRKEWSR
jgi:AbrB family looped-hinge helix DNA binding protein